MATGIICICTVKKYFIIFTVIFDVIDYQNTIIRTLCTNHVYHVEHLIKIIRKILTVHYSMIIKSTFPYFANVNIFSSHYN